jgi:exodeoxyribonuclease VII large subunit
LVQGEYAKDSIVKQIKKANQDQLVDVIILGRGGGSIEDLWPFNEESVAYAIYESALPIISSVGHETDFTISDFVADLRAPTPSGGAEIAVPNQIDLLQYLNTLKGRMRQNVEYTLKQKTNQVKQIEQSILFRDPRRLVEKQVQSLMHLDEKLHLLSPQMRVKQSFIDLRKTKEKLHQLMSKIVDQKQNRFILTINRLDLLNPLSIMKKGYSVTMKEDTIIKSVTDLNPSDTICVKLRDGDVKAIVNEIKRRES